MTREEMYNFLTDVLGISEDYINGAICVGGYNEETFIRVLEYTQGYHSFEQFIECELSEEE